MPRNAKSITRADIISMEDYGAMRKEKRAQVVAMKKNRRMEVGPVATFYFENYDTMWQQIHEMLYIERGGENQITDELAAYNPLIPNGRELIATMMIEIEDEDRRRRLLARLGHIEQTVSLKIGDDTVPAIPEMDTDRTDESGKASAVHFLHFPLNDTQATTFKDGKTQILLCIAHENYQHMAVLPTDVRNALAKDLD